MEKIDDTAKTVCLEAPTVMRTILLVEDEKIIAKTETRMLKKHGFEVVIAYDGETAIETVWTEDIDLILMDIDLGHGRMDGTEAAEGILKDHNLPIVFLTAHAEKEMVDKVKGITRYGYVLKNSGEFVLIESVNMAFELFEAHRQTREKEEQYELALYGGNLGTWDWNIVTDEEQFNDLYAEMLGYSLDEIPPHISTWAEMVHPDDFPEAREKLDSHLRGETPYYEAEMRMRHKTGKWVWISDRGKVIERDREGNPVRACGTHLDITERKEAELAIKKEEKKYRELVETIQEGIWIIDREGYTTFANPKMTEMLGYKAEEMAGRHLFSFMDREAEEEAKRQLARRQSGLKEQHEFRFTKKTGEDLYVLLGTIPFHDEEGKYNGALAAVMDISKRKQIEKELKEREQDLRITLESIGDAVISTDMGGRVTRMNAVAQHLTGYGLEEARHRELPEIFHIIDSRTNIPSVNPVEKVLQTDGVVNLANHTKLISKDGREYIISDSAAPIKDEKGNTRGVVLVFRDETEKSEQKRFLKAVFDSIQELISVQNMDLQLLQCNQQVENMFTHAAPLEGKKCFEVYHGRDEPCEPCPVQEVFETKEVRRQIIEIPTDAGIRLLEVFAYPVFSQDGEVRSVVEYARDVTEIKQKEADLEKALREKDFLMKEMNHRIKNNLALVKGLIALKDDDACSRNIGLSDIMSQIDAISIVHQQLYSRDNLEEIEFRKYIQDLLDKVFSSLTDKKVSFNNHIEHTAFPPSIAIPLGLIINEAATNTLKYGNAADKNLIFAVEFSKTEDRRQYELKLSNNGPPFPEEIDINDPETLGLRLILELTDQLNGTVELSRTPHPVFTIYFPDANPKKGVCVNPIEGL